MILLDPVVQIPALANANGPQRLSRPIAQPVLGIAGTDCLAACLTAVDNNAIGPAMACDGFSEETPCRDEVSVLAEEELDRVTDTVDGAVKVHPLATDLDVRFVDMPFAGHAPLASVEALQQ